MSHPESIPSIIVREEEKPPETVGGKILKGAGDWLIYKNKGEWLKDMRGSLSMTASIIATMTFQLATNPPGGVLQVSYPFNATNINCARSNSSCPGEAVLAVVYKDDYHAFLVCNTISFVASLSVCLLLVSGIPLDHPFLIWLLSIGMCITITSLTLTYLFAASMVTPDTLWYKATGGMFNVVLYIWIGLLGIVGFFLILRLFLRGVNKWTQKRNGQDQ